MVKRCPVCGGKLRSLYYFLNTKKKKKWVKAGYVCIECGRVFSVKEVEKKEEE